MKYYSIILLIYLFITTICYGQNNIAVSPSAYLTSQSPETPSLISPTNFSEYHEETIILQWQSQIHTSFYSLQVSKESGFTTQVIYESSLSDTTFLVLGLDNNTTYYWRVNASNVSGESNYSSVWSFNTSPATAIEWEIGSMPDNYMLHTPYPNPFHSITTIKYNLPEPTKVVIKVYNELGQAVRRLVSENKQPGKYKVLWDGRSDKGIPLSDGLYVCVLLTDKNIFLQKLLLKR